MLYAYNAAAPQHEKAKPALESAFSSPDIVGLPWVVLVAFLRIGTNPRALPRPYSVGEARDIVDAWLRRRNVKAVSPGPNHWSIFRELLLSGQASGNLASDAHLAAMAIENGATLITTDRDFSRFDGLRRRNPLEE